MLFGLFASSIVVVAYAEPEDVDALDKEMMEHYTAGRYAEAEAIARRSLDMRVHTLGAGSVDVASSQNNLGAMVWAQGRYAEARALYEQSLAIQREVWGPRHRELSSALNNLALVVEAQGDPAAARLLFEEAVSISKEYADSHPDDYASNSVNLAKHLYKQGDYDGPRHPRVARSNMYLARVLLQMGDHDEALRLLEEAVDIQREVGPNNPDLLMGLDALAAFHHMSGNIDAARVISDEALTYVHRRLSLLDGLSEREALSFLPVVRPSLDRWLTVFDRPEDAPLAWAHMLAFKGTIAARARAARALSVVEPEISDIAAELDGVRRELAQIAFADNAGTGSIERMRDLGAQQEGLERELLSQSSRYRASTVADRATPEDLCKALPEGAVLIDVFRYLDTETDRYLAFVQSAETCVVHRVDLGKAEELEAAALDWQEVLRDPASHADRVTRRGRALAALLWEPLAAVAGDRDHWLVVPDGHLASVPFGAVPKSDGRYAIEDHLITYLDRAGDVLPSSGVPGSGAVIVGGVDYDATSASDGDVRSFLAPCNGGAFADLPGTNTETESLAGRWKRARRREPLVALSGAAATETAVGDALEGKALAHIATHGFFASEDCRSAVDDGVGYDPMLLSGLVLAGANQPPAESSGDGILTASEVATRNLSGTELVVLSACETGLGEIRSGQGVLGLRRAFAIAGARTLVMSLWSVPDEGTTALMDGLYRRHLKRRPMSAASALREARLDVIEQQRAAGLEHPFSWAAFISSGDW